MCSGIIVRRRASGSGDRAVRKALVTFSVTDDLSLLREVAKEWFVGLNAVDALTRFPQPGALPVLRELAKEDAAAASAKVVTKTKYQDFTILLNREYFSKYITLFRRGLFDVVRPAETGGDTNRRYRRYFSGAMDLRAL